jgi:hypothetical protein
MLMLRILAVKEGDLELLPGQVRSSLSRRQGFALLAATTTIGFHSVTAFDLLGIGDDRYRNWFEYPYASSLPKPRRSRQRKQSRTFFSCPPFAGLCWLQVFPFLRGGRFLGVFRSRGDFSPINTEVFFEVFLVSKNAIRGDASFSQRKRGFFRRVFAEWLFRNDHLVARHLMASHLR